MSKNIIIVVLAIISVGSLGYLVSNSLNSEIVGPELAKTKMEDFINENLLPPGTTAKIDTISEESDLYKISVALPDGVSVDSYMSRDAKFFFPEGINIDEFTKPAVDNLENNNNQMELKTEILTEGSGDQLVKSGDTVSVDYTGTLEDGTQFDSSIGKDPFSFTVGQGDVIAGWDQGLLGMKIGEERKLTIPSDLAYGVNGYGPIPPNATLIFTIKLISIN
ncbi:MAG: FKBP-type peptidyl-prolyl cis-trans isomerase [Patescibacteria group bacterium]|jgi:hypothetical protein